MNGTTRVCKECEQNKPIAEFSAYKASGNRKAGWRLRCKACESRKQMERYHANHEVSKERAREKYYENLVWSREYYKANKEKFAKYKRDRYTTVRGRAVNIYNAAKNRAIKKGVEFNLTRDWIEGMIAFGSCSRSGARFDLSVPDDNKGSHNPFAPSIDRKDPNQGYTMTNCQIVAWCYNTGKGTMSDTDFIAFCKQVAAYNSCN